MSFWILVSSSIALILSALSVLLSSRREVFFFLTVPVEGKVTVEEPLPEDVIGDVESLPARGLTVGVVFIVSLLSISSSCSVMTV